MGLEQLYEEIISCEKCTRLRDWCISQEGTKKEYKDDSYWSLPLPGFGDPEARVLITGLAPAAHGGNRTGRVFTGDTSGQYLFAALYRHGFSNQERSFSKDDSLELNDVFITNVVKCAPPKNKPDASEFSACSGFLEKEIQAMENLEVILAFGGQAFERTKRVLRKMGADVSAAKFGHGVKFEFGAGFPVLMGSYHTSQYNINTRRITPEMLDDVFEKVKHVIDK
ncbi:uracil-DNA glycosylase [Evansella clarkii]|uniref:uracil-DNA glycosylase n=1 Tax=Evansella clarkii TaxID=79879 RepID=UPI00099701C4|nr:uracil-DNA glycosylase [Evansella clarkii]